jgi:alkylation response protein AidB-like acyl-CoA dehydrogenase
MDFEISSEQKSFCETIRRFAKKEIEPLVDDSEENEEFPIQIFELMGKHGYLCICIPEEYGGAGANKMMECDYIEELSYTNIGIALSLCVQAYSSYYLLHAATEAQKQKYLLPAVKGKKILGYAATEPNAGSDRTLMSTNAVKKGNKYLINGTKMYITNAGFADALLVEAFTDKSAGFKGMSLFIVDKGTPGFSVSKKMSKLGARSSENYELIFEDCLVPEENMVGAPGRSQELRQSVLAPSLALESAHAIGVARAAYEASLEYSKIRVQFNRPIGHFQGISFKIADMALALDAARLLAYRVAWLADHKMDCYQEGLMSKLFASEMAVRITDEALQIHGAYGYMMESPIQRYLRDARMFPISKGPSNIYRILIARGLGLIADDHYPAS